jgi:hypothetical protein
VADLIREMGLERAEFLRLLPAAVAPRPYRLEGDSIQVEDPGGGIRIRLHPTTERRIAGLGLPVTRVEFTFEGLDSAVRNAFMEQFERHYQRGGG